MKAVADDLASLPSLAERGLHFEVVTQYHARDKDKISVAELLIIAKSSWALGLVDQARQLWDEVLAHKEFDGTDRARAMLARAILELQENQPEQARRFAELAAATLPASELRGQLWLVIAESLRTQGALSMAEGYYRKAISESSAEANNEARFLLGECQFKLGLTDAARETFVSVNNSSAFSAPAMRRLLEIDLQQRDYENALNWATEGVRNHPEAFGDAWVQYAIVTSLIELNRLAPAQEEMKRFAAKHSPDNEWFQLAESAIESQLLQQRYPRARLRSDGELAERIKRDSTDDTMRGSREAEVNDAR